MKIKDLFEDGTAGGTSSGSIATVPGGGQKKGKKTKVNLLGFAVESDKDAVKVIKRPK